MACVHFSSCRVGRALFRASIVDANDPLTSVVIPACPSRPIVFRTILTPLVMWQSGVLVNILLEENVFMFLICIDEACFASISPDSTHEPNRCIPNLDLNICYSIYRCLLSFNSLISRILCIIKCNYEV